MSQSRKPRDSKGTRIRIGDIVYDATDQDDETKYRVIRADASLDGDIIVQDEEQDGRTKVRGHRFAGEHITIIPDMSAREKMARENE